MSDVHLRGKLSHTQAVAYSLPFMCVSFLTGPLSILQGVYAKYFGLALTSIAMVLLISRLFDAVTDPLIGYFSDRYYEKNGTRKPFIFCGGLLFVFSSWLLYVPPDNVSTTYFLGSFLAFYFSFTLFEIPHLAWGSDIAKNHNEKNIIYSWRTAAMFLGSLLFFTIPLLPIFETNAFTPQTLMWSVLLAGGIMLPLLYVCVVVVPDNKNSPARTDNNISHFNNSCQRKESLEDLSSAIFGNPPLLWFLAAFFCAGIGVGMWFALIFFFVDSYLGLGEQLAWVYIAGYGVGTLTLGGWSRFANHWGKKWAWCVAMVLIAIGIIGTAVLSPGIHSQLPLILGMILIYSGFAGWIVLAPSLLSDIIDYGTWKLGKDRAGTYFALYTMVSKANYAIDGALGLGITGAHGFDATAVTHSVETVFGLRLALWLSAPLVLMSILFMAFIPLNARRHAIIRRCLDARASENKKKPNVMQTLYKVKSTKLNLLPTFPNNKPTFSTKDYQ